MPTADDLAIVAQREPKSDPTRDGARRDSRIKVGEALAARLNAQDLMDIFRIKQSQFYKLRKAGRFDRFELRPTIGRRAWRGKLVLAFLNAEGGSSRFNLSKPKKKGD
jgi:hypothetical protein